VPMIHGDDGQKLSKRHGAVSVMQYHEDGFLPEAVINYLARLGWSHGNDEIFNRQQLLDWFDGTHLSQSPSQFDTSKLRWLNQQYLIAAAKADPLSLVSDLVERLTKKGVSPENIATSGIQLPVVIGLLAERSQTLEELADQALMFFVPAEVTFEDAEKHLTSSALVALVALKEAFLSCEWSAAGISSAIKSVVSSSGLKMPQIAVPLRLKVFGKTQTPSIDATLAAMKRDAVLQRL
jgi:glutamyl-tRNA synthetase